jgi:hypothetical protein
LSILNSRTRKLIGVLAIMTLAMLFVSASSNTYAQACTSNGLGPERRLQIILGAYRASGDVCSVEGHGFSTVLGGVTSPAKIDPPASTHRDRVDPVAVQVGPGIGRVFCRRDDYAFLPPQSTAGIPCESTARGNMPDPSQVARSMFDQLELPSLRLNMNPRRGMVAVPTWFWVEGYNGDVIPLLDTLVFTHEECHRLVERDDSGQAVLDDAGSPVTRRECQTISDSLTVEVRVWPRTFVWSFGDSKGRVIQCSDAANCPQGVGLPFTDVHTPSPIAHAYHWSSLGANGLADAYTVGLGITFGAQYRFSINGSSRDGWDGLADRTLAWSTSHQVQEAQAVLTRP